MRTREQNREYINKYRFKKKLEKIKSLENLCHLCGGKVETLHHINENQSDNRLRNLLPVCKKCHLEIPHQCDKDNFYGNGVLNMPRNAVFKPKEPVTPKKTLRDMLNNCNTRRIYNITLIKPGTLRRIHITEGSSKLLDMFANMGFELAES